uniref:Uncharacterized protein n=1 Tax=viral metagenome TaxID=1070528 RepID=A0A6C0KMT9_9ZZZZ
MLYLAYDNAALPDGAGGQIQRILSIYLIARHYGIGYIHQGIQSLSYQGSTCMEKNKDDPEQIVKYNELFNLPSAPMVQFHEAYKVYDISEEIIREKFSMEKNVLLVIQHAGTYIDEHPERILDGVDLPWNFPWKYHADPTKDLVKVAVHVRRGELFVVDSTRMLPNSYYVECMRAIEKILKDAGMKYEFHFYTEQLTKPTTITPGHHGICNRIKEAVTVRPEDNHLEDFAEFKNIIYHINGCPVQTLIDLTTADVLLASRSSFSYVAGMVKKEGVVLFHPFWHSLAPSWIPTRSASDIVNAKDLILKKLNAAIIP